MKTKGTTRFWLMKSEPESYSIDDLKHEKKTPWEGVRNYQARNFMRDEMQSGDGVLFYHSSTKIPGVAGIGKVVGKPYPDPTQFDRKSHYFDPKSTKENPRWFLIDVKFVKKFKDFVSLFDLKLDHDFDDMMLMQKGSRLSIQPVSRKHFDAIVERGK
ncbi:MAG TPA: EVE domain-containing protein [Candidatus Paceibacterota bacterium]|nr:EVE domain-containing protein [Candidatus Paceibacterota bacterium]